MKFVFILMFCSSIALAQTETDTTATQTSAPVSDNGDIEPENVKLFIDKIEVEGRLEKPQAVFILPGQTPTIDDIQIERSFMKEIFRPVEKRTTFETKYKPEKSESRKDVIEW